RLRGVLLPLIRLADVIGIERTYYDPETGEMKPDRREKIYDRRGKHSPLFNSGNESKYDAADDRTEHPRSVIDRRSAASSALNIVVVSTGSMKYGLIVDRLQDS